MKRITSPFFESEEVARKRGGVDHRKKIWAWVFGTSKRGLCPLCEEREISLDKFEASHIVAHMHSKKEEANRTLLEQSLHLVPSCSECNMATATDNVFDFLYLQNRIHILRSFSWKWFTEFSKAFPSIVEEQCKGVLWMTVHYMFGKDRYFLGGIDHEKDIYYLLYMVQLDKLRLLQLEQLKSLQDTLGLQERVLSSLKFR